ncbi:MAG: class I SAM-dependent methyltransferase [Flavobacteriia bacterium]|nr:class I SAM-dependent methyltransferase [Flavobacteriia bacterium]
MKTKNNYLEINKESWNNRTEIHLDSEFYDVEGFLKGKNSLNEIELKLFGDLKGKKILHLQCHFGQDTISLARMGAIVTGIDLSNKSIESAQELAKKANIEAQFICCDVYDLPNHLDEKFDIVYTSYGTIGWLPDLNKWGQVISTFLNPGGKFIFVEFHPIVWMFDDHFEKVEYNYLNKGEILETHSGTYTDLDAPITQNYVCWNHGIAEVVMGLISNDLEIGSMEEYDFSPYNCFNEKVEEFEPKRHRVKHLENKIPLVYSIVARKKDNVFEKK